MNSIKHLPMLLMALSLPAHAEIFKCKDASGKINYQSLPCPSTTKSQGVVKVKELDPQTAKEAEEKLKAWEEEHAAKEAAEMEEAKQRQIELDRKESLAIQRRAAIAQEQQAIAAQQRLEQENRVIVAPLYNQYPWGNNYYPNQNFNDYHPPHNDNHDHTPHDRPDSPLPPSPSSQSPLSPHTSVLISPHDKR
jgi:hypothetical protein